MSLAARTREILKLFPCIHEALRVGVINYTAAARYLPITGDNEAVASALRRYSEQLSSETNDSRDVTITMHSEFPSDSDTSLPDNPPNSPEDPITWLLISGEIEPWFFGYLLLSCHTNDIAVHDVYALDSLGVIGVPKPAAATALRCIERVCELTPG